MNGKCFWTTSHHFVLRASHRKYSCVKSIGSLHSGKLKDAKKPLLSKPSPLYTVASAQNNRPQVFPLCPSMLKFTHYFSTCSHTDALLEDISICIRNNELSPDNIYIWFSKICSSVFDNLSFHMPCQYPYNRKKQILYNIYSEDLKTQFSNNRKFQEMIHFVQVNLNKIEVAHYPVLLNSMLPLIGDEHPLVQKLSYLCKENIQSLGLREIVIFLESCTLQNERETRAEVLELVKVKSKMLDRLYSDPDSLEEFLEIFMHNGNFISKEISSKRPLLAMNCISDELLKHQPIDTLNALCKFPLEFWGDCDEDLKEKVLELECKLDKLELNLTDLDIDSCLYLGTVLDPALGRSILKTKRWELFKTISEKSEAKDLDPLCFLKLCFLFYTTDLAPNFMSRLHGNGCREKDTRLQYHLAHLVDLCDNFWLVQMLKLCSVGNLPTEITKKIHKKLKELVEGCSTEHLKWLLDENGGELTLLLFNNFMKKTSSNDARVSSRLMDAVNQTTRQNFDASSCNKTTIFVMMQQITDYLLNDHVLSSREMECGLKMVSKMDIQTLIYLMTVLKTALFKGSQFPSVKKQIRQLQEKMRETFEDQLSSTSFLPPTTLLPKQHIGNIHPSIHSAILWSCPVNEIIESLAMRTSGLEEQSCFRAIIFLSEAASQNPCFVPETFENLLEFVYKNQNIPSHIFLALVETISMAGYQPEDAERFKNFCVQFQQSKKNLLKPLNQLQLVYHLSLLEIYDNIDLCLSVDKLLALDKEMNNLQMFNPESATVFWNCLSQLIRNVVIECPHLSVHQFVNTHKKFKKPEQALERLHQSVKRIFNNSTLVSTGTYSPYGHSIDALVNLDWDGFSYQIRNPISSSNDVASYRLALLYLSPRHFCRGSNSRLTGLKMASIRQLQLLGYTVIEVPYFRLQMMDLQCDNALDCFIKSRIQSEVEIDRMFDLE